MLPPSICVARGKKENPVKGIFTQLFSAYFLVHPRIIREITALGSPKGNHATPPRISSWLIFFSATPKVLTAVDSQRQAEKSLGVSQS